MRGTCAYAIIVNRIKINGDNLNDLFADNIDYLIANAIDATNSHINPTIASSSSTMIHRSTCPLRRSK